MQDFLNVVEMSVKRGKSHAELIALGDVHYGSPECDIEKAKGWLNYALENGCYVLLMGDLMEMATRNSIGSGVYLQKNIAQEQLDFWSDTLRPLAEKKLIIGSHSGNHENRAFKDTGVDVMKILCDNLKINYLGDACWSQFKVGRQRYSCYSLHGSTGSRFIYTKLKSVSDIANSVISDLVLMGHTHELGITWQLLQEVRGNEVIERKRYIGLTGHFLRYGGYAQSKGYPIGKTGCLRIKLFKDRHNIHTTE